jgi:hypothetical protein
VFFTLNAAEAMGDIVFDEKLAQRIRKRLSTHNAVEKHMFGGLCFMVNDAMCCGVHRDDFVARVGADRHEEAMQHAHVRPMDITGRPMRGFLFVGPEGVRTDAQLNKWLNCCISRVDSNEDQKRPKRRTSPERQSAQKKPAKAAVSEQSGCRSARSLQICADDSPSWESEM